MTPEKVEIIRYREFKSKQAEDIKSKVSRNMIYRRLSTPFTYLFVKAGFSPDAVSILNFFPIIFGFYFISIGTYKSMVIGLLFFILYKVWDCSDGEVARVVNKNAMEGKYRNMEGAYFDSIAHLIYPVCLGMGIGIGLHNLYKNDFYFTIGLILSITLVWEYGMIELAKAYYRRGIIDRKIRAKKTDKEYQVIFLNRISGKSYHNIGIIRKFFGISPFQGFIFLSEFLVPILIVLLLIDSGYLVEFPVYGLSLVQIYLVIVCIVKLLWIVDFIRKMKKYKYISGFLDEIG